jgi:hypothetical protein
VTTNKKPAPHLKEEFFAEHLPYEIDMLRATYELVRASKPPAEHSAVLESFLMHARNLIEFYKDKPSCDFDPRMFTVGSFQLNKDFIADSVLPRINKQVSHLTARKVARDSDKLGPRDWALILRALEEETNRFGKALTGDYAAKWPFNQQRAVAAPTTTPAPAPQSFVLRRANLTAPVQRE